MNQQNNQYEEAKSKMEDYIANYYPNRFHIYLNI